MHLSTTGTSRKASKYKQQRIEGLEFTMTGNFKDGFQEREWLWLCSCFKSVGFAATGKLELIVVVSTCGTGLEMRSMTSCKR